MSFFADSGGSARPAADAREEQALRRLKQMRWTATSLLALMIIVLVACNLYQGAHGWLVWPRAFAEAGTVGAIADWYAVVALFRRPLGLRVPHTAIISQNQQRIAERLGDFVHENFLAPDFLMLRLAGYNATQALGRWLARPSNSRGVADVAMDSLVELLDGMDEDDLQRLFEGFVIPHLRTLDLSRATGRLLQLLTDAGRHQPLLDCGLEALKAWLTSNAGVIRAKFSEASLYTPAPLDAYIVRKFIEGIVALLGEVAGNPEHELRRQLDAALQALISQLQTSSQYRRFGHILMRDCIRHVRKADSRRAMLEHVRAWSTTRLGPKDAESRNALAVLLVSFGRTLRRDPAIQRKLNAWWLALADKLVTRYGRQLSALITEVVQSWKADEVSRKIETEIGRDLQFIRINGTFVGGMVGVLLHAATLVLAR